MTEPVPDDESPPPGHRFSSATPLAGDVPHEHARRPDLVLLPGMLADARVWDPVAERLLDRAEVRFARIDLDGSIADLAAGVLAEAPARFALAGHSLGAIVALEVVRRAPERVSRLALLNSSARGPTEVQRATWSGWRSRLESGEFGELVAELASTTLPAGKRGDAGLRSLGERMGRSVGAAGLDRQLAAQQSRTDLRPGLAAIAVPALVLSGELDEVSPPALQAELAAGIPGARLETLPGVGHMSPIETPDAVAAAVLAWLPG